MMLMLCTNFKHWLLNGAVGFDITGTDIKNILFGDSKVDGAYLASNAFIQFEDISAKSSISATVDGIVSLAGVAELGIQKGSVAFGFGLGIDQLSEKIYFKDITSTALALRQKASWRKIGVMDISLPLSLELPNIGNALSLHPLVTITDGDLFDTETPSITLDLNLE